MDRVKVGKGNTLLLHGPASAILVEGRASVLGCPLSSRRRLIVKSWRSRPIYAEEDSIIDVAYGEGGGFEIVEGDTIPSEWRSLRKRLRRNLHAYACMAASILGRRASPP